MKILAIKYIEIKATKIERMIKSEDFKCFKKHIETVIGIKNDIYEIVIENVAYDESGLPNEEVNARVTFKNNYSKVDKIVFFRDSLGKNINRKFGRISHNNDIFNKIADIYIKNALVHELVHIKQFENGKLTIETIMDEKKLHYTDRTLEIEAENRARKIISSYGNFEEEIMKYISSKNCFTNDSMCKIEEIYLDKKTSK